MTTRNPTTGDAIKSRPNTKQFRDQFESIFGPEKDRKKKKQDSDEKEEEGK